MDEKEISFDTFTRNAFSDIAIALQRISSSLEMLVSMKAEESPEAFKKAVEKKRKQSGGPRR